MSQYVIGIDFGTLSARALLINLENGAEEAISEFVYPHAVLPLDWFPGIHLDKSFALQHPQDYLDALQNTIHNLLGQTGIAPEKILGIGIDFTSSTLFPVLEDGTPLCFLPEFQNEPHAYSKLWKHHGGDPEAKEMTAIAIERNEPWLPNCGGRISSEWMIPKILETLRKAPNVYHAAFRFIEAADWLTWKLTGTEVHSSSIAGLKAFWIKGIGYPTNDFFTSLDPAMDGIIGTKLSENMLPVSSLAGRVNELGSELTGLAPGTAVSIPAIDAIAGIPGAGMVDINKLMIVVGTSSCHYVMSKDSHPVDGIQGFAADCAIPGYIAYEAGQCAVGDNFAWFVDNCVPEKYALEARAQGKSLFALLDEKAAKLEVGESGLLALDWWNGNRCPYADFDLSGMMIGMTLNTKPEEMYRAILEASTFGTKWIVDMFEESGIQIDEAFATGGIVRKNPFLMQMYADVLGKAIHICKTTQAGAKGSAIYASVACGYFASVQESAAVIADTSDITYYPNPENTKKYERLYREYRTLCEYFSGENNVMKRLK